MLTLTDLINKNKLDLVEECLTKLIAGRMLQYYSNDPSVKAWVCGLVDRVAIDSILNKEVLVFFNTGVLVKFPIDEFFELVTLK